MDGQDVLSLSWMAKERKHYHGWPRNIVIVLHGQGISSLSPPYPSNIILVIEDQGVDYSHGWLFFLSLLLSCSFSMSGQNYHDGYGSQ